jgi:uncharacterized protein with HEPN domain
MKDDTLYISHILSAISDINELTSGLSLDNFLENKAVKLAVVKSLEVIGEASKNISEDFKIKHNKIPWKDIIRMRDKTIHRYFGISYELVWKVVKSDIPQIERYLKNI